MILTEMQTTVPPAFMKIIGLLLTKDDGLLWGPFTYATDFNGGKIVR
jgi:hypothetical protein